MNKPTTKQKILEAAIRMYNEKGVQNVTSRHIAAQLGISHGNLDYHYNTKEDLMLAIYDEMRSEMSEWYAFELNGKSPFTVFQELLDHLDKFEEKYRFFNLDVLEILRSFPKVATLVQDTLELRKRQMSQFFESFIEEGLIIEEPDVKYERVKHTIRILITFWLSQQEVLPGYKSIIHQKMSGYVWGMLLPFMTEKGLEEYHQIKEKISAGSN